MDISSAALVFLDRIERNTSDLAKAIESGIGSVDSDEEGVEESIKEAILPASEALQRIEKALEEIIAQLGKDPSGAEIEAIRALQNAVTVMGNRVASDMARAITPLVESHGKLLPVMQSVLELLGRKRTYKMSVDRNYQTKLIQAVTIEET